MFISQQRFHRKDAKFAKKLVNKTILITPQLSHGGEGRHPGQDCKTRRKYLPVGSTAASLRQAVLRPRPGFHL
jgi:hypothetical protein